MNKAVFRLLTAALALLAVPAFAQNPGLAPGGTVYGNRTATQAPPAYTAVPVLGIPGSVLGRLGLAGSTSGTVTITPQAAAGTPTLTLPNASGTFAVSASSPLVLSATTGDLTCPTCLANSPAALTKTDDTNVTLTLGGSPSTALLNAASIAAGWTGQLSLARGGTAANLTASNGGLVYSTASALAILSGTATANQIPLSGSSTAPAWSTATYPGTAAAGTVLAAGSANVIAGTATPTLGANGGTGGQITLNGSTSGSAVVKVAAAAGTTTFQLPVGNGTNGFALTTNGSGVTSWTSVPGSGTVTSITCGTGLSGGTITTAGTCASYLDPGSITNCTLTGTVSANALTIALKTQSGADPSASVPCFISFRNATNATGDYTVVSVTAATSFATGTSGSTFGSSSGAHPFRLWIVGINNGGTVVLGVTELSNAFAGTPPLPLNEGAIQSTTACNACTNAATLGTIYSTAAQTSKAIRILGYMEWGGGLTTAGTWASGPTIITMMTPGIKRPGDVVQYRYATSSTSKPFNNATQVQTDLTASITPTSASNMVKVTAVGALEGATQNVNFYSQISRGSSPTLIGASGNVYQNQGIGAFQYGQMMFVFDGPEAVVSTSYFVYIVCDGTCTGNWNNNTKQTTMVLEEIQG